MNKGDRILTGKNSFFTLLVVTGIVLCFLAPKAAVNVDEMLHYPHAKKVVNWYFTGGEDVSCLNTPATNLKYYGQSPDNLTALINRIFHINNEFITRHFTGAFFFWMLLLFSGLLAFTITGTWWASVIALFSLVLMPSLSGHAFGNLKDIPFAAGYIASIFFIVKYIKELPGPRWNTAILLSIAIAFTSSVRIGGLILFFYLALFSVLFIILKPFFLKHFFTTKSFIVRLLGQLIVIVIIGYFAGLLFWPFALQDVFSNPLESLRVMEHYKINIRQVFEGEFFWSNDLPWYYLPKWLFLSTPEFVMIGMVFFTIFFIFGLFYSLKSKDYLFFEIVVLFTSLFPLFYVIAIDSNLYSGTRQLLFALPGIAVLVSVGIIKLIQSELNSKIKFVSLSFFFGMMFFPFIHQVKTFPVDYVYFNSVSGGNSKAWGNYEYDYYFHGIKEPAEDMVQFIKNEKNTIVASNCNLSGYFENSPNIIFRFTRFLERSSIDWDYAVFGINYIHPYLLKNDLWKPANSFKTYFHKGNPVAVIVKRGDKTDLKGITKFNEGDFDEAQSLLRQAVKADSSNVWLYVQLAQICLIENNLSDCRKYIEKGKKIYPFYEPLYLLEADCFFHEEKFAESYNVLQNLQKLNSMYEPAIKLMEKTKEKLNILIN